LALAKIEKETKSTVAATGIGCSQFKRLWLSQPVRSRQLGVDKLIIVPAFHEVAKRRSGMAYKKNTITWVRSNQLDLLTMFNNFH